MRRIERTGQFKRDFKRESIAGSQEIPPRHVSWQL
jgi:mRNA-degrading endonuclease YafQ of YafQ-DinJ toxin-antitoxin module